MRRSPHTKHCELIYIPLMPHRDPDQLQTTSNEAYNVVKGTGRTAEDEYEVLQDLPSPTSSSGPTTTDADGDYEPV